MNTNYIKKLTSKCLYMQYLMQMDVTVPSAPTLHTAERASVERSRNNTPRSPTREPGYVMAPDDGRVSICFIIDLGGCCMIKLFMMLGISLCFHGCMSSSGLKEPLHCAPALSQQELCAGRVIGEATLGSMSRRARAC